MKSNTIRLSLIIFVGVFLLISCSSGNTITIDAPEEISTLLTEGAGDNYTYYAIQELQPEDWDDVSSGALWICNEDDHLKRPPLLPEGIVNMLNGGGFSPGTVIQLEWEDQEGAHDSSVLNIDRIIATYGITYEGCTEGALEKIMEDAAPGLLLTDTDGTFDGKDNLLIVEFD